MTKRWRQKRNEKKSKNLAAVFVRMPREKQRGDML